MSSRLKSLTCRICLKKTEIYISLLEGNFVQIIQDLTNIEVDLTDSVTKVACLSCVEDLKDANDTRQRIIESDRILKESAIKQETSEDEFQEEIVIKTEAEPSTNLIEVMSDDSYENDYESNEDGRKPLSYELDPGLDEAVVDAIKEVFSDGKGRSSTKRDAGPKKKFKCPVCDLEFEGNRYAYNLHMCKHKKSECKICGIWIRSDNMAKHLECHTSGPRVCDLCGTTCKNVESLRGHIFYMHRKAADEYKCDQCDKSFRMKYKLHLHKKKEHIGLRNVMCPTCNKGFFTSRDMTHHVNMTHLKLRPHVCAHCQRGFSSKYALKTHVRQHTNETPYKCHVCADGFRQNVSLRTHLKSKHNVEEPKDFRCEFCEKGFSTDHALKVHLRLHTDTNYTCDRCGKLFAQRVFLENHHKWAHHDNS